MSNRAEAYYSEEGGSDHRLLQVAGVEACKSLDLSVQELFEKQASRTPNATAVVFGNAILSYAELDQRANQLAHYLHSIGVRQEMRVALCVERCLNMIV